MLIEQLQKAGLLFTPQVKLSAYTTFQLGGSCSGMIHCEATNELITAVRILSRFQADFILIGGGSNLLVSDNGIDCYVIRYVSSFPQVSMDGEFLEVSGCTILDDLVNFAAQNGWAGLNYASGIPGTVGGAVVGNAGAFGQQVGDILETAYLMNRHGEIRLVPGSALNSQYRSSALKTSDDLVVSVKFRVSQADQQALLEERKDILEQRCRRHPDLKKEPCAGSYFRNIEPTSKAGKRQSSGWFLEKAGVKSFTVGGAAVCQKHANIITKARDDCLAQDVFDLAQQMSQKVKEKFRLKLVREVRLLGRFDGEKRSTHHSLL